MITDENRVSVGIVQGMMIKIMITHIVGKSIKIAHTVSSREEIAQKRKFEICLKIAWNTIKRHVWPKYKQNSAYMSTGKKKRSKLKNSTEMSASSTRFSNYDHSLFPMIMVMITYPSPPLAVERSTLHQTFTVPNAPTRSHHDKMAQSVWFQAMLFYP